MLLHRDPVTVTKSVSISTIPNVHVAVHLRHKLTLSNTFLNERMPHTKTVRACDSECERMRLSSRVCFLSTSCCSLVKGVLTPETSYAKRETTTSAWAARLFDVDGEW